MTEIDVRGLTSVGEQAISEISLGVGEWLALAQEFFSKSGRAVCIMKVEEDGPRIVFVNDVLVERLGHKREAILNKGPDFWDLVVGGTDLRKAIGDELRKGNEVNVQLDVRTADGGLDPIDLLMSRVDTVVGTYIILIANAAQPPTARRRVDPEGRIRPLEPSFVVCSYCDNVREPEGPWTNLKTLIHSTSVFSVSHGICPMCFPKASKQSH